MYMYVCMYVRTYVRTYICMYVCMYVHTSHISMLSYIALGSFSVFSLINSLYTKMRKVIYTRTYLYNYRYHKPLLDLSVSVSTEEYDSLGIFGFSDSLSAS